MIQLARSPLTKMSPDPAGNAAARSKEGLAQGTPSPRSPPRSHGHRRLSTGIEEDAIQSLMKLATPVKSPGPLHTSPRRCGGSGTENTPAAGIKSQNGTASGGGTGGSVTAEMTPVSLFRKSRQQGELGQLQSPFQSPFRSFQFSPSCLFSPPGAGTLDIPLASGDTPGPGLNRDIWQQTTPDTTPRSACTGSASGIHGINGAVGGGGGIGGARGTGNHTAEDGGDVCVKRKGKALFTDKRGPQDHSRLGQGWCLDTPGRARDGIHHAHLGVADIPATPDRVTADGSHVLPPTPQLLAPTPPRPPRACGTLESTAGEGAAGILLGLRSPEGVSSFGGGDGGSIAHSLFAGLVEGYDACRSIAPRNGSADDENGNRTSTSSDDLNGGRQGREKGRSWSRDCWAKGADETGGEGGGAARVARAEESEQDAPRALKLPQSRSPATSKRYRRWASPASSLRNSHCKSSFKIEGMTLIRTGSCSSSGSERSRGSGEGGGGTNGRKQAAGSERSNCRMRSRGQSIADEPLSPPPSAVVSPEVPPLAMSRSRSLPSSPAKPPTPASKESTAVSASISAPEPPATAPRVSTRAPRTERPRRTPTVAAAVPARTTPSRSTRKSSSQTAPSTASSSGASTISKSSSDPESSLNSPEATTTATSASLRRGRTTPRPQTPPVTTDASSGPIVAEALVKPEPPAVPHANGEDPCSWNGVQERHGATACNCKKSKCLKLYCECFQRRQYCTDCNCQECLNTPATEDLRQSAIQSTIERNPAAFESKFEKRAGGRRSHNSGCNCKKSACLKKYCECFQAGVACASNCKCTNCKNFEGASGGRKRRAAEAALTATQPPRTPPRASGRCQRGSGVAAAAAAGAGGGLAVGAMGDPSLFGRFMEPVNEADSGGDNVQVQVGEEDEVEIDGKEKSPPLAKVLRANVLPDTTSSSVTSSSSTASGTNGIATNTTAAGSHGDGGGDVSGKSHVALASTRLGGRSQGASPAAAAVADHAVARSLLDMGGTPPQVKVKTGAADDTAGFKLSVATGDGEGELSGRKALSGRGADLELAAGNGVVSENMIAPATESDICVAGDGGSEAVGTGKRLGYANEGAGVGMEALLNRARSETREKQALLASPTGDVSRGSRSHAGQADAGQEKVGAGYGGLEATKGKTGGKCLTPSLPAASPLPGVATARAAMVVSTSLRPKLPGFGATSGVGKGKVVSTSGTKTALGVV